MQQFGPKTEQADKLHSMKYREPHESFREAMQRLSYGLQDNDQHYHQLRPILLDMRFLAAGRIQAAMGAARQSTAFNCFVSGTISDSLVDGQGSIMERLKQAAATMRLGGGIGYNFSTIRPRGDLVTKLSTNASGPMSFMKLFNLLGDVVTAAGERHGAQMGVLHVSHPDIMEFIHVKQNETELRRFNLSVSVDDAFLEAAFTGKEYDLKWGGKVYKTVDAAAMWEAIMRSTYDWGEPGIIFANRTNEYNNLWYCEEITATNPCAEQPLPPFGACLLGSFNLPQYLTKELNNSDGSWSFDFDQLKADIPVIVRAIDNVIDRTRYPLAEQRAEAISKRRMGLGITGLANAAEACGYVYGTKEFLEFETDVLTIIRDASYRASIQISKEKGPFPLFDADRYLGGKFTATLPDDIRRGILDHGIRNSHLTSIAPTGTISMCADNISSSIEPVFKHEISRIITTPEGPVENVLSDYGYKFLGVKGRLAGDVTALEHIEVLAVAQKHVDSAVSKTVNMDSSMPWSDFKNLYKTGWEKGCKSLTTFNSDGLRGGLLKAVPTKDDDEVGPACEIMADGTKSCE